MLSRRDHAVARTAMRLQNLPYNKWSSLIYSTHGRIRKHCQVAAHENIQQVDWHWCAIFEGFVNHVLEGLAPKTASNDATNGNSKVT